MKNRKKFLFIPVCLLGLTACETMEVLQNTELLTDNTLIREPDYVLSFHETSRDAHEDAQILETGLELINGETVNINVNSLLHTRHIKKIRIVPMKDDEKAFDLELTLDRRGKLLWSNLSHSFQRSKIALLIDGIAYKVFVPTPLQVDPSKTEKDEVTITIPGPFDLNTAANIASNSEFNYEHFNK